MKVAFQTAANIMDEESVQENLNRPDYTINPLLQSLCRTGVTQVFHYGTSSIEQNGSLKGTGHWINLESLESDGKFRFSYSPAQEELHDFGVIFVRGDDVDEQTAEQALLIDSLDEVVLVNSGAATLVTRDKFEIPERFSQYPDSIPQTYCVKNLDQLDAAWAAINGEVVVLKGRYGSAGREVEKFPRTVSGYEQGKKHFERFGDVVVQEYLPEIRNGDVRIFAFDGEILGAFKRTPGQVWKTNIMGGGRMEPIDLPRYIVEKAKTALDAFPDVRFQGLDVTYDSGKFIETNAFPCSLGALNTLYGEGHEDKIIDKLMN